MVYVNGTLAYLALLIFFGFTFQEVFEDLVPIPLNATRPTRMVLWTIRAYFWITSPVYGLVVCLGALFAFILEAAWAKLVRTFS